MLYNFLLPIFFVMFNYIFFLILCTDLMPKAPERRKKKNITLGQNRVILEPRTSLYGKLTAVNLAGVTF